jgi:hypothetical protein
MYHAAMTMTGPDAQTAKARLAARMIPAYSRVLAIGPENGTLESVLPVGCSYVSGDSLPTDADADIAVMLAPPALMNHNALAAIVRDLARPLICVWPMTGLEDPDLIALCSTMKDADFRLQCVEQLTPSLGLLKWVADVEPAPAVSRRVLVMSYYNSANFGDRLGYHVLNSLLPAEAEVTYGTLHPWNVPDRDYDLLILGIGNSLIANDACMPELAQLIDKVPRAIGIFGIQFRDQFSHPRSSKALEMILGKLTTWWARYEEDILAFGRGRTNVRHLGDWLVAAFPMTAPTLEKGLNIPAEIISQEMPLDRMIQSIQTYRAVSSARLHTLLCALTSADETSYQEQRIGDDPGPTSGKFRSMLYDVFGRTFEEDQLFRVDREAVIRYKSKVQANLAELRAELFSLLGCRLPGV